MALEPLPGYVLVELGGKYHNVTASSKVYEGATEGIIQAVGVVELKGFADPVSLIGRRTFWSELVAGSPIARDGKSYVFVRIERLEGTEPVE